MKRKTIIEHEGVEYPAELARIIETTLGFADVGLFVVDLECQWDGYAANVVGRTLDSRSDETGRRRGTAYGLDFIMALIRTVGVVRWEDVRGILIHVLHDPTSQRVVGIANCITNDILIFEEHSATWRDENGQVR